MGRAQIYYQQQQWQKALNDYNQVVVCAQKAE